MHEKIGNLKYPIDYLLDRIPPIDNTFSISILHHPLNWQTPEYSKEFREFLLKTSDIIISGHEHSPNSSMVADFKNDYNTIHFESGALQDSDNDLKSNFNLLNIDTESKEIEFCKFQYKDGNYGLESRSTRKIEKVKKLKTKPYQLSQSFIEKLQDPGASFIHSKIDKILLEDIYVPPYLQHIRNEKAKKSKLMDFIHSDSALEIEGDMAFYKLLLGAEYSGKTAILKYFYLKYYRKGFIPIYIQSENIDGVESERIKKFVMREFKKQYDELDSIYSELDFNKVVILIDDFHNFKPQRAKIALVNNLKKLFSKIIITGSEVMMFESYRDKHNKTIDVYEGFDWLLIREFNPSLRDQLIKKWYRLGFEYMDIEDRNIFYRKVDQASSTIDAIVGKSFIPPFPVFILTILQGLETGDSESTGNKQHAYYYEQLITRSLKKVLPDKDDIGFYMTLSKEYFYFLFKNEIRFQPIGKDDFFKFLDSHKKEYKLSKLNYDNILKVLKEGRIISLDMDGNISVAYKYLYYFFVAKYLSDNLDEKEIQDKVDSMADRVYRDEYSNIIIFLTHLARNKYVLQKLIEKSRQIYNELQPAKLDSDIDFINDLQKQIPEKVIAAIDIEDARQIDLSEDDEQEEMEKEMENTSFKEKYSLDEDVNTIDFLAKLTKALRTLDILGQLTKRYWGELKGDHKYDLAEETYLLGLRTLQHTFSLIEGDVEDLISYVKRIVEKRYQVAKMTKEEIKNASKTLIFSLCSGSTFSIIKRIVNAIGTEKLSDTFNEILQKNPSNSISITNAAIKLEHYSKFPSSELEELRKTNEKNPLAFVTLQNFLINYMYSYDLDIRKRQQLCDKWKIKMEDQRVISQSSPVKLLESK